MKASNGFEIRPMYTPCAVEDFAALCVKHIGISFSAYPLYSTDLRTLADELSKCAKALEDAATQRAVKEAA